MFCVQSPKLSNFWQKSFLLGKKNVINKDLNSSQHKVLFSVIYDVSRKLTFVKWVWMFGYYDDFFFCWVNIIHNFSFYSPRKEPKTTFFGKKVTYFTQMPSHKFWILFPYIIWFLRPFRAAVREEFSDSSQNKLWKYHITLNIQIFRSIRNYFQKNSRMWTFYILGVKYRQRKLWRQLPKVFC